MSTVSPERRARAAPAILCTGIAVLDMIWRVETFPPAAGKAQATEFRRITGGCAVNAAIAVARLGGRAHYAGPLGSTTDPASDRILADLADEGIDSTGVVRVAGATVPTSGILIDAVGERMIATHRDPRISSATPGDADAMLTGIDVVLADNRLPEFVLPICRAARERSIPVVVDADKPGRIEDALFALGSHVIFSSECLRATTGEPDLAAGLQRMAAQSAAFLAVTNGDQDIVYLADQTPMTVSVFQVTAVDTLAAGDVFHAGVALALGEGRDIVDALQFGAAAAGLKCTRFGGSAGAPRRSEVDALLARRPRRAAE